LWLVFALHIYSQNLIELRSSNKEYGRMFAKSFGMSEDDVLLKICKSFANLLPKYCLFLKFENHSQIVGVTRLFQQKDSDEKE